MSSIFLACHNCLPNGPGKRLLLPWGKAARVEPVVGRLGPRGPHKTGQEPAQLSEGVDVWLVHQGPSRWSHFLTCLLSPLPSVYPKLGLFWVTYFWVLGAYWQANFIKRLDGSSRNSRGLKAAAEISATWIPVSYLCEHCPLGANRMSRRSAENRPKPWFLFCFGLLSQCWGLNSGPTFGSKAFYPKTIHPSFFFF